MKENIQSPIEHVIAELCPQFHRAMQPAGIREVEDAGCFIDVDKMNFSGTYVYRKLRAVFKEASRDMKKYLEVYEALRPVLISSALDFVLNSISEINDVYMVLRYDKNGLNPKPVQLVEDTYKIEVEQIGETRLSVAYQEDGCYVDTVVRRVPSFMNYALNLIGDWTFPYNHSLHRLTALLLRNKLNDAALSRGYNPCLLVPEKVDQLGLPKVFYVCKHRFDTSALEKAGYDV